MNWHIFKRPLSLRAAALFAACIMIIGSAAGGTLAWLVHKTAPVTNVFTSAFIGVQLTETPTDDGDNNPDTNSYLMLPGTTIRKDPLITVEANSEDAWLFVKLEKSENFDSFLSYHMAEGWNALEGDNTVFWRKVQKENADQSFGVIADDQVQVKSNVTAYMLNTLTQDTLPTLRITAYAVQQATIDTPLAAWALALSETTNP